MLSLKYRPFSLDGMIGQKGIINEFKNRTQSNTIPQVMIFEGESGSGKSCLSYIIAAILNCKNKHNGNPCGRCASCRDIIDQKFSRDVVYIDASSKGKEDITNLKSTICYTPLYDDNIVVIVNEAQELSSAGKGATLDLLEKPRNNVYFILCTMNMYALDNAVKSRGQVYKFWPVDFTEIASLLYSVMQKEVDISTIPDPFIEQGIFTIAENSNGNVRNALQYLERCIYGKYYTEEAILNELGFLNKDTLSNLILKILKRDKTFFEDIKKLSLREFALKAYKILTELNIYIYSGVVYDDWKKKYFEQYLREDSVNNLINIFDKSFCDITYFHDNYFTNNLISYFKNENPNVVF